MEKLTLTSVADCEPNGIGRSFIPTKHKVTRDDGKVVDEGVRVGEGMYKMIIFVSHREKMPL